MSKEKGGHVSRIEKALPKSSKSAAEEKKDIAPAKNPSSRKGESTHIENQRRY